MGAELAVEIGRLAVETGVFPLIEVVDGRYRITEEVKAFRPLKDYLKIQGRFRHLTKDMIDDMEARIQFEYRRIQKKVQMSEEERDGT